MNTARNGGRIDPLLRTATLLLSCFALSSKVAAHQLDEYVQATLVDIEPNEIKLQINLTPGTAVAEQVLNLIDHDHNGVISTNEATAYAEGFKRDLTVRLDNRIIALKLEAITCPASAELRTGWGIILLDFSASPGQLTPGTHTLTFENQHLPAISTYLINATRPRSASVQINAQKRNQKQSSGEVTFKIEPSSPTDAKPAAEKE